MKLKLLSSTLIPILTLNIFLLLPATYSQSPSISRILTPTNDRLITNRIPTSRLPVVIWHGLSDSYASPSLDRLAQKINLRYPGTTVYKIRLADSDSQDRRATWFGSANEQVDSVCNQLSQIDQLSLGFDAIGFSQGGQFMRAYVERCNRPRVRNLITLGSQHMGVSGTAPCTGLFDLGCHVLHKLIQSGTVYGPHAQKTVIPAQYFRDQSNLTPYMKYNQFLRDINNERWNDTQPADSGSLPIDQPDDPVEYEPRNETYKQNFQSLENFVMFRFSVDTLVIPPTSAYFTIPNATESTPRDILDPIPIALQDLPIYQEDYIGLRFLDEAGRIHYGTCFGAHMQIDDECWENVMDWLGEPRRSELLKPDGQNHLLVLQND